MLVPLHIPLLAALVVDCGSGTLAMLVFLVTFLFALYSLWSSPGLRYFASWPVWTRRTVTRRDARSSSLLARLVLLVENVVPFCGWQAQDAWHHGRYGSE